MIVDNLIPPPVESLFYCGEDLLLLLAILEVFFVLVVG